MNVATSISKKFTKANRAQRKKAHAISNNRKREMRRLRWTYRPDMGVPIYSRPGLKVERMLKWYGIELKAKGYWSGYHFQSRVKTWCATRARFENKIILFCYYVRVVFQKLVDNHRTIQKQNETDKERNLDFAPKPFQISSLIRFKFRP